MAGRRRNDAQEEIKVNRLLNDEELKSAQCLAQDALVSQYGGVSPLEQMSIELFDSDTLNEYEWRLTNGRQYDAFCRIVRSKLSKLAKLNAAI